MLLISHQVGSLLHHHPLQQDRPTHSYKLRDIYTKGYRTLAKRFSLRTSDKNARLHAHKKVTTQE